MQDLLSLLTGLLESLASYIPGILSATVILIVGYLVGRLSARLVRKFAKVAGLDTRFERSILGEQFTRAGYPLSHILDILARTVVYTLTILAALSVLNIGLLNEIGLQVALYLPKLAAAIIVFLLGAIFIEWITDILDRLVFHEAIAPQISALLASGLKYLLYATLIFVVFDIAQIAPSLLASIAQAVFLAIALSLGLTIALLLGLGLKDEAIILVSREASDITPGTLVEVGGTRGSVVEITTFMVKIRAADGSIVALPKSLLVKKGYRILPPEET